MPEPKTIEEHREYLHEIVKLKLFFIWHWLKEHPDEELIQVLHDRVDIFRKTAENEGLLNPEEVKFDSPGWLNMEKRLTEIFEKNQDNADAFEEQAFEIFRDSLDTRLEKDFNDKSSLAAYQCGSLRYNEYEPGTEQKFIIFHIANAIAPRSIFDDPKYLPECFMELMRQSREKYKSTGLQTSTWLNSYPRWLALFPKEWHDNLSADQTDVQWHYGFWGQFITSRGTFNFKSASHLRKTGRLLFYPRRSQCTFKAMKEHLEANF